MKRVTARLVPKDLNFLQKERRVEVAKNRINRWLTCTLKTSVLLLHVKYDSNFLGIWSVYF